jgi:hypothetical protein
VNWTLETCVVVTPVDASNYMILRKPHLLRSLPKFKGSEGFTWVMRHFLKTAAADNARESGLTISGRLNAEESNFNFPEG